MKAAKLPPFQHVTDWSEHRAKSGWWHSFELPDGSLIEGVCDLPGLRNRIGQFPIPADLTGKRVLDIGTWDGWFAFEMERRGAEVVAIDTWDNARFRQIHAIYRSKVDYRQIDMYELTPDTVGTFDIVLFMGVLYHLKHPLLALERVCALTRDLAVVDSFVLREKDRPGVDIEGRPVMEFYETTEFGGQPDNWVAPTTACLLAFCRTAGFARVELQAELDYSACVACYRHFPPPNEGPAPELTAAVHRDDLGVNFSSRRDDSLSLFFRYPAETLTRFEVQPEISGYGSLPLAVVRQPDGSWQANCKLPPLDRAGWHDVRLRVKGGQPSAPQRIAVDVPLDPSTPQLTAAADGATWQPGRLDLSRGRVLSLWSKGLPVNADRANVRVFANGLRLATEYVQAPGEEDRQVNVSFPAEFALSGHAEVYLECGPSRSDVIGVDVLSDSE